ncbi:Response regulator receiver domain-containing protein [Humidesulfovibrio mexicanus]|uniref:Response regulator receiver domain-containing protein n=1 Tax=Humidesulfovibrio mexicanus TaxID=147047 RepID=A0A239BN65_9BACT|nr:response regulator [Humidesulfovibrio mexicanus]SNS08831.1 Response regulator receiver domain-containing protein [Humidesulfovibrio mexicanus]
MEGRTRVLVVDDEQRFAANLVKLLGIHGIDAEAAFSGEEALPRLREGEHHVVLLDVRLSGITGQATLERLRQEGVAAKVIALTGHASAEDALELIRLGAFDYLLKPCNTERLLEVIGKARARYDEERAGTPAR